MADEQRVFRVTVRGRFGDLTDAARGFLARQQAEHDIFSSAYTPEGTFTYDLRTGFFNLRYEVRAGGDDPTADAGRVARTEAETFLRTMGIAGRALRVQVTDVSAVWDDVERRRTR